MTTNINESSKSPVPGNNTDWTSPRVHAASLLRDTENRALGFRCFLLGCQMSEYTDKAYMAIDESVLLSRMDEFMRAFGYALIDNQKTIRLSVSSINRYGERMTEALTCHPLAKSVRMRCGIRIDQKLTVDVAPRKGWTKLKGMADVLPMTSSDPELSSGFWYAIEKRDVTAKDMLSEMILQGIGNSLDMGKTAPVTKASDVDQALTKLSGMVDNLSAVSRIHEDTIKQRDETIARMKESARESYEHSYNAAIDAQALQRRYSDMSDELNRHRLWARIFALAERKQRLLTARAKRATLKATASSIPPSRSRAKRATV